MSEQGKAKHKYDITGTVPLDSPNYVKRKADDELYEGLRNGDCCCVFNSRQTGKSSLLIRTKKRLSDQQDDLICIRIDLSLQPGSRYQELEQWIDVLIKILIDRLKQGFHEKELEINLEPWRNEYHSFPATSRLERLLDYVLTHYPVTIVILLDEIDSVLDLKFTTDDFFAFIRACYNQRGDKSNFRRITFGLFGVATPSELIRSPNSTPFNIGREISLDGFELDESSSLAQGLDSKVDNSLKVLEAILDWTGGQPFLTQKICKLIANLEGSVRQGEESQTIENLVKTKVIDNWESQDSPQHFRTIQNRLLPDKSVHPEDSVSSLLALETEKRTDRTLKLYQRILQGDLISVNSSYEQTKLQIELLLSGLVIKKQGKLQVANKIYKQIFNEDWITEAIADLRPYREALEAWLLSEQQDKSRLLTGAALEEALTWAKQHNSILKEEDHNFLDASEILNERRNAEQEARKQAEKQLDETQQKLNRARLLIAFMAIGAIAVVAFNKMIQSHHQSNANSYLQQKTKSESKLEHLLLAMQAGKELRSTLKDQQLLGEYAFVEPLLSLRLALNDIHERNQFNKTQGEFTGISFSYPGNIVTADSNGQVLIWKSNYKQQKTLQAALRDPPADRDKYRIEAISSSNNGDVGIVSHDGLKVFDNKNNPSYEDKLPGWGQSVSFSSDGQFLAVGYDGGNKLVLLKKVNGKWSKVTNQPYLIPGESSTAVKTLKFSPKKNLLAIGVGRKDGKGGKGGKVYTWDLAGESPSWQPLGLEIDSEVVDLSFSLDEKFIAVAGTNGKIKIGKRSAAGDYKELSSPQINSLDGINSIIFGDQLVPQGSYFIAATTAADNAVHLWGFSKEKEMTEIASFKGHTKRVLDIKFSQSDQYGQYLASAGADGTVRLWDLSELKAQANKVSQIAVSADSEALIEVRENGEAKLWNKPWAELEPWKNSREEPVDLNNLCHTPQISHVDISESNLNALGRERPRIAVGQKDGFVCILQSYQGQPLYGARSSEGEIQAVYFGPQSQLTSVTTDGKVHILNEEGNKIATLNQASGVIDKVVLSLGKSAPYIVTLKEDGTAQLWNQYGNPGKSVSKVADIDLSPDGQIIGISDIEGKVRLATTSDMQMDSPKELPPDHQGEALIRFSPSGKFVASVGKTDHFIQIYNSLGKEGFKEFMETPSLNALRSLGKQPIDRVFSIKSWKIEGDGRNSSDNLPNDNLPKAIIAKFSPNEQLIAVALENGTIKLWDLNGRQIAEFPGAPKADFEFSPDGKLIVYVNKNNQLEVESITLDGLLQESCNWLEDYFKANPEETQARKICIQYNPALKIP